MPDQPMSDRAERLRPFFALQLHFAEEMARHTGLTLPAAVLAYTNLHRRFGLGDPDRAVAPLWAEYAAGLEPAADRLAWTLAFFRRAPGEAPPGPPVFGCFTCEPPDAAGTVRIHLGNRDGDGISPLHRTKITRRRQDLAALVAHIDAQHPTAERITGMSWLYHLDAYRRLFPPEYGASAQPLARARLSGMSSWGQFLTHDEMIKPALRDAFLRNLATLDPAAPWRSFPLPALRVSAPLAAFRAFYAGSAFCGAGLASGPSASR